MPLRYIYLGLGQLIFYCYNYNTLGKMSNEY